MKFGLPWQGSNRGAQRRGSLILVQAVGVDVSHRFLAEVAASGGCPLVVLFPEDNADEAQDRSAVGEDSDDAVASADLAVEAFKRVGGVDLGPVLARKAHVGQESPDEVSSISATLG